MLRASASSSAAAAGAGARARAAPRVSRPRLAALPSASASASAAAAAADPQSSSSSSFLAVQLAQKEAELAALLAPGRRPPPAAVVGRLRDELVALQAAADGLEAPPPFVSPEAAARAEARAAEAAARAAEAAAAAPVPRLLRPGSSAKYVGGGYGGEEQAGARALTPGGLPKGARRAVPPGPPTPVFAPALVTGRLVPWPAQEPRGKQKGAAASL
jgi:hypothetical protein